MSFIEKQLCPTGGVGQQATPIYGTLESNKIILLLEEGRQPMKAKPNKVNEVLARQVMSKATLVTHLYSDYIVATFRSTGNLAPGCDNRDLIAWYEQNMPTELAAITVRPKAKRSVANIDSRIGSVDRMYADEAETTLSNDERNR